MEAGLGHVWAELRTRNAKPSSYCRERDFVDYSPFFKIISFRLAWPITAQSRDKQTRAGNLLVFLNGLSGLLHCLCSHDPLCAYTAKFRSGDPTRHAHFNVFPMVRKMVITSLPWKTVGQKVKKPAADQLDQGWAIIVIEKIF